VQKHPLFSVIPSFFVALFLSFSPIVQNSNAQEPMSLVTLPKGTVLRLALSARTSIGHIGQPVEATIVEPVYSYDRLVIPAHTKVTGKISELVPSPSGEKIIAMTGGDFTPLHDPVIQFDRILLQNVEMQINTEAVKRNTQIVNVRDTRTKGPSIIAEMKSKLRETIGSADGPSKMDRLKNYIYSNLPYHPQVLDRGSLFDAILTEPLQLSLPQAEPADLSHLGQAIPPDTLAHARLATDLDSHESLERMPVKAVLTEPIYGSNHELLYPEGTELLGKVIQVHKAGWFARSGELRFGFYSIRLPEGDEQQILSQIGALEAQKNAHVTIDAEGGTKAHMGGRFLAPVYSMALAGAATGHGNSRIKRAIISNGFSILGRVTGMAGPASLSTGLSYYGNARSVYLHMIRKGPEAKFPENTRLELILTSRD
jgi:hypothetical protein